MGTNAKLTIKQRLENFKAMEKEDKRRWWGEFFIDNSLYIFLIAAIIGIAVYNPNFVSMKSIINIVSLSAANLPIALGIAGAIILTGTDLSAGRVVGLTACVAASLLQMAEYPNKMFPGIGTVPVPIVILAVIAIGALVGAVNGFCTAKFNLHPFIVTLATQLIVYGTLLIYLMQGNNNGQSISGLDKSYTNLITGSILSVPDGKGNMVPIPNFVWYAIVITVVMWFVWNKTTFGKNMFAVGSNPEAANVSGVNVAATTILVFTLAGVMYGFTGFIEGACAVAAGAYFLSDKKIPPRVVMVPAPEDPFATGEEALDAALEKARDDLEKLEVLNARIPAAALSAQISRMEKAGAAILQQVREHPEKGRDIRKFVTYYLPTAVKILTTYADLSASGAGGENAKSLMSDVEKNAGTIAAAFEAQLDALFAGEVLDVSSDIAVLDGMLSGDGLSGKNNLKLS